MGNSPDVRHHELHRGAIKADGSWILLRSSRIALDPVTVKYFGEGDAGLLATADELHSRDWVPAVSIISGDVGLKLVALGRQLKCFEPADALDSSTVRGWLGSTASVSLPATTVQSLLAAAPTLVLADAHLDIGDIWSGNPDDVRAKITSHAVTLGVTVNGVESGEAFSAKATGRGVLFGYQCAATFGWEATTQLSDDGEVEAGVVIDFPASDTTPGYVVQGVRHAMEMILARRFYPPAHPARAWFNAIFAENRLEPLQAWLDVAEPFDFELESFSAVVDALEECERRWPDIRWPDASDFVDDLMHQVGPGQIIGARLEPGTAEQ